MEVEGEEERVERGVEGFYLLKEFLTREEEENLINEITEKQFEISRSSSRQFQSFVPYIVLPGGTKEKKEKKYLNTFPNLGKYLLPKILKSSKNIFKNNDWSNYEDIIQPENADIQINLYFPNSSIPYHFDDIFAYKSIIFGVSLCCDCYMNFESSKGEVKRMLIPARSLYFMSGSSRYKWKHGIEENSLVGGERRISITFRHVEYSSRRSETQLFL